MDDGLGSRVAIVTGASRGIGLAVATELASRGASVVLTARKEAELQEAVASIKSAGGTARAVLAHAGRAEDIDRLVAATLAEFGRIDILINNAATNPHFGPVLGADTAAWDKTFEVNVRGPFLLTKAVVNGWMYDHGGAIVNVASVGGLRAAPGLGVYNVTKAAMIHLTRQLAFELGERGIRVNAVAPGVIETRFSEVLWKDEERRAAVVATNPMRRTGMPDEVARVVVFLATDEASYINGQVVVIDGGGGGVS